ncbi:MAG TPA: hypothetical protein VL651_15650 [Bacteroidia bacterium]|nr:hypothetical protein [Bacteroidia bacterium]
MKKIILFSVLLLPFSALLAQMPETDIWTFNMHAPTEPGRGEVYTFTNGHNLTNRPGYDNQPWFTADGKTIYWTSVRDSGETDIYCHNAKGTSRVTKTNISEYSPQFIPGTKFMTCVVVEQDSTQRLWKYDEKKPDSLHAKTEILFPDLKGVAYYKWLDANTVFIADLPEPMTLYIGNAKTGELKKMATNVGRSFATYEQTMCYTWSDTDELYINACDANGNASTIFPPVICYGSSQDFAITKGGMIFMAEGTRLYSHSIYAKGEWKLEHDFAAEGLHKITRLAISPDGNFIALTDNL